MTKEEVHHTYPFYA